MKKHIALLGILASYLFSSAIAIAEEPCKSGDNSCATGQDLGPIKSIGMYLDGYHTYQKEKHLDGEKQKQIRTAHYCKQVNPDLFQCLIYDSNRPDAKVIGVEYVITDKLFKTLPESEKAYWHYHYPEVDTGLLTLPGLSKEKQAEVLALLRSTHGKTWQVWPDPTQALPLGAPELMWSVEPEKISTATKQSAAAREKDPLF